MYPRTSIALSPPAQPTLSPHEPAAAVRHENDVGYERPTPTLREVGYAWALAAGMYFLLVVLPLS